MHINWETVTLTIAELKQYDQNPRSVSKKSFSKLVRSIKEDGYHQRIIVDSDNRIIGGHARRNALLKAGYGPTDTIEVLRADRTLSEDEFRRINIRDNLEYGEFDFEILANNFDPEKLVDWGMDKVFANIDKQVEKEFDAAKEPYRARYMRGMWQMKKSMAKVTL